MGDNEDEDDDGKGDDDILVSLVQDITRSLKRRRHSIVIQQQ
jgi:hypothetical protein